MARGMEVDDTELHRPLSFYRLLPSFLRLDVLPFSILYTCFGINAARASLGHGFTVALAFTAFLHALAFFTSEWSLDIKCWMAYSNVELQVNRNDLYVKVIPLNKHASRQLCQVYYDPPKPHQAMQNNIVVWFAYQKQRFCFVKTQDICFKRLEYPTKESLEYYTNSIGYTCLGDVEDATLRWHQNEFHIPMPHFWELLKQHLVAPFFVFQFFCMLLWCLDEYMYYSLLTLAMLILFECTVVKQRQHNMELLRQMQRPPTRVFVYRMRKWFEISSVELVPGDIVSVGKTKTLHFNQEDETLSPCDLLLLQGTCIVNEAMLSGESIPLRKEMIQLGDFPSDTHLNMDDVSHKKHVIFGGTKGNLMRTILFSAQRMTANNRESMLFILFLLCFAIAASIIVLVEGKKDPTRSMYKLFLHCVMIITSVVPPELPMELSLAVTNSLLSLSKMAIFCTEPFRIPYAGKVDIICFDKTGTLTSDALEMCGIAGLTKSSLLSISDPLTLVPPGLLPSEVQVILASCHSLMILNGVVSGDPLEKTVLAHLRDWHLHQLDRLTSRYPFGIHALKIVHRCGFSSELKRMSAIVLVEAGSDIEIRVVAKGAPEVMKDLYTSVPSYYTSVYQHYALKGSRVLALGYKSLPSHDLLSVRQLSRAAIEKDLIFAGFLVLDCPLKEDSIQVVNELQLASNQVAMITGDNALTACDVARQVKILPHKNTLSLQQANKSSSKDLVWVNHFDSEAPVIPFDAEMTQELSESYNLCLNGEALRILSTDTLQSMCPYIQVYARTSPEQKEGIIEAFNNLNMITAMCGDGTNDVGALKKAHVGISIINNPEHNNKYQRFSSEIVQFGDASIASPFTSKSPSIQCTKDIIRQGRCTLVTTLQMYKILGVNCLITAYVLSFLYLYGVKQGDTQLTCIGLLVALFFLFLSYAEPASELSYERPVARVFSLSVMLSIIMQFMVHLASLIIALSIAAPLVDFNDPIMHADAKFHPNILNSIMFLISTAMQITTFVANYRGQPFMESFHEHKLFSRCAYLSYIVLTLATFDIIPSLNSFLQLVPMPSFTIQLNVSALILLNTLTILSLEHGIQLFTTWYPSIMA
ncbi:P-type ATPase (P-ATPase) Superfamily [Thraustotheca clavata]|uniref:P-type ATPase (P-ATPase) Superfamily n=1 Tax=Thraustotheca clavata TaxID=74557 RepID=A0A1W0A0A5_9STRA|nr:P-type ATPase (P-ATPase) Superfamily [Thraustotheca clavata]